jgi:hypothetical protein
VRFANYRAALLSLAAAMPWLAWAEGEGSDAELATKLNNPVASLISVPLQSNWDHDFGQARDGWKYTLNVQPVVPSKLNGDWTLISRVIVPLVDQHIPGVGDGSQQGVGDITGEFFFVPSGAQPGGITWGIGPAVIAPTYASSISAGKWALGPTAVILKQESGMTYGALAVHSWSVAGSGPQNISSTFFQPFFSYTNAQAWTVGLNAESTYDWKASQWTVPFNATVSKLTRVGKQPVSVGAGVRWYADSPVAGPHGIGYRLVVTFLFPGG